MAWNDLSISQRSQLMNMFRHNGVSSLSEMRRLYDLSSFTSPLVETSHSSQNPVAPMYAGGGQIPPQGGYENDPDFVGPSVPYGFYDAPIDLEDLEARQHYAESRFKANQTSHAGAKGPYQIMPRNWEHYSKKLNLTGDVQDYNNSKAVRDQMMKEMYNSSWAKKGFPSDSVRYAKTLAGYNWGSGNLTGHLQSLKDQGVDIYHSMDWIDTLPPETKNYVNFILRRKNGPADLTNEAFEAALPTRFDALKKAKRYDMGGPEKSYEELIKDYEAAVDRRKNAWSNYEEANRKVGERIESESERVGLDRYDYRKDPIAYQLSLDRDYSDDRWKADAALDEAEKALGNATINRSTGTTHDLLKYPRWDSTKEKARKYLAERGIRESLGAKDVADFFNSYAGSEGFQRIINNQAEWGKNRYPYKRIYNPIEYGKAGYTSSANQLRKTLLSNPMNTTGVYDMNSSSGLGFNTTGPDFHFIINAAGNPFANQHEEEFPYWFELTHEMLHDYNFVGGGQGDALEQNVGAKSDGHDNLKTEKHSDLEALRFMLFKEGIYDSRGNVDATPENIKKLRELYPNIRPLQQMSNEQAAWMINHVADINNGVDMSNIAAKGGKIHIKPENRGKFTALKKRTGKSASWFKAHGTPAQRKMATFALNAAKWHKKGHGGILF